MTYHCYLLPYIIYDKKIYVLIGKKLCYSSKDGFIHNNPGQFVFIGGGCNKSPRDDKIIKSAIREFVEETGNYVNINNTYLKRYIDFSVTFYKVSTDKEYNIYSKLNPNKKDKWAEIKSMKWVTLKKAIKLMNPKNDLNQPCNNKLDIYIKRYIKDWRTNNWESKNELKFFKKYLEKNKKILSVKEYNKILNDIRKNGKKSIYYEKLFNYLNEKIFQKKSYTDWYYKMAIFLKKNIDKIDNQINKNKKPIRKSPIRKSPIRKSPIRKSPKKLSIRKSS